MRVDRTHQGNVQQQRVNVLHVNAIEGLSCLPHKLIKPSNGSWKTDGFQTNPLNSLTERIHLWWEISAAIKWTFESWNRAQIITQSTWQLCTQVVRLKVCEVGFGTLRAHHRTRYTCCLSWCWCENKVVWRNVLVFWCVKFVACALFLETVKYDFIVVVYSFHGAE